MKTEPIAIVVAAAVVITPSAVLHGQAKREEAAAEALIRQRVEDLVKAVRAKDLDAITSSFAPNLVSSIRYRSAPAIRRGQHQTSSLAKQPSLHSRGPIDYEVRDLKVTTNGELAFVHSLQL